MRNKKKSRRKFKNKIFTLILGIIILIALVFFLFNPKMTFFSIKQFKEGAEKKSLGEINMPSVSSGEEKNYLGYKYSNNSGVIISTKPYITCYWKPDSIDDRWKKCEAIFEVDGLKESGVLENPKIKLYFKSDNVRDIKISYSDKFEIDKENYNNLIIQKTDKKINKHKIENNINLLKDQNFYSKNFTYSKRSLGVKQGNFSVFGYESNLTAKINKYLISIDFKEVNNEKIFSYKKVKREISNFNKRKFGDFISIKELSNVSSLKIENYSEENLTQNQSVNFENNSNNIKNESYNETLNNENLSRNDNQSYNLSNSLNVNEDEKKSQDISENKTSEDNVFNSEEIRLNSNKNKDVETGEKEDNTAIENPDKNSGEQKENSGVLEVNLKENKEEGKGENFVIGSLSGLVIKEFGGRFDEGFNLDLSKPFAIKVEFEIPKYNSNNFNFSLIDSNFQGEIDPEVSSCGILDSPNSIYSLDRDISSVGDCIIISAKNISFDCKGHKIIYSTEGAKGYGIYSNYNNSEIKNCVIDQGNADSISSVGIYLEQSSNSKIINNSINILSAGEIGIYLNSSSNSNLSENQIINNGNSGFGIYFDTGSNNFYVSTNNISVSNDESLGIYILNSESGKIINNFILNQGYEGESIFMDSSQNIHIEKNNLKIYNNGSYGIASYFGLDSNINNNNITSFGDLTLSLFLSDSNNISIEGNILDNYGASSDGLFVYSDSFYNIIKNNFFNIFNSDSEGIYFSTNCLYNQIEKNNILVNGSSGDSGAIVESSNFNRFYNNSFEIFSADGLGIYLYDSNFNDVSYNNITSYRENSFGLILNQESKNSTFRNNFIKNFGDQGFGFYLGTKCDFNSLINNQINTSGVNGHGIYLLGSNSNYILKNEINSYGYSAYCAYFSINSTKNFFYNNTLFDYGDYSSGIYFERGSSNNTFGNNFVNSFGNFGYGIILDYNTGHNNFFSNNISTYGQQSFGVEIYQSNANSFNSNQIFSFGENSIGFIFDRPSDSNFIDDSDVFTSNINSPALYIYYGNHNFSIENSELNASYPYQEDFFIDNHVTGGAWNFTNVNFLEKYWGNDARGNLVVSYSLGIHVNFDNLNASGANVSIFNQEGFIVFSNLTNDYGEINDLVLLSYIQTGPFENDIVYYSNYTVNITSNNISLLYGVNLNKSVKLIFDLYSGLISEENLNRRTNRIRNFILDIENINYINFSCNYNRNCSIWSDCINGNQTRTCSNLNPQCNNTRPELLRSCSNAKINRPKSKNILFDVSLRILKKELSLNEKLESSIYLINLGIPGKVEGNLLYRIKNDTGTIVYEEKEKIPVETQIEFVKIINLSNLKSGNYKLSINWTYQNQTEPAYSEDDFSISENQKLSEIKKVVFYSCLVILIFLILYIILFLRKRFSDFKNRK